MVFAVGLAAMRDAICELNELSLIDCVVLSDAPNADILCNEFFPAWPVFNLNPPSIISLLFFQSLFTDDCFKILETVEILPPPGFVEDCEGLKL